jgi:predicted nucleotidyltransferase
MIPKILDRTSDNISATNVRKSILGKTSDWKSLVPEQLHEFVEKEFPTKLYEVGADLEKQKAEHEKSLLATNKQASL